MDEGGIHRRQGGCSCIMHRKPFIIQPQKHVALITEQKYPCGTTLKVALEDEGVINDICCLVSVTCLALTVYAYFLYELVNVDPDSKQISDPFPIHSVHP